MAGEPINKTFYYVDGCDCEACCWEREAEVEYRRLGDIDAEDGSETQEQTADSTFDQFV